MRGTPTEVGWSEGAQWIGRPENHLTAADPVGRDEDRPIDALGLEAPVYLRRQFTVADRVRRATLTVTALGLYRAYLNGQRIGDHELAPGWTDYRTRVHGQTYDVTDLVFSGENVLAGILAGGWYCGFVGFDRGHHARRWGSTPRLLAWLEIDTEDSTAGVRTDGSWRWSTGQIVYADLQMGEMHDPRLEPWGWSEPGFDDRRWSDVEAVPHSGSPSIEPSPAPPIRITEEIPARTVARRGEGFVVDFGQNLVGVVRLRCPAGIPGARTHLRHGEALDREGALYTDNLRTARAHDIVVSPGEPHTFQPCFTFHGFRYVEVTGFPGELAPADITALVMHTDTSRIGWFECSEPDVNRLHENVDWTIRGNTLDVPTDCPQRDERLGWLGDAQLTMPSAAFVRGLDGFLAKWSTDLRDAQGADGAFPDVAPRVCVPPHGAPGWADGGALIPWTAYLYFGRAEHLAAAYESIATWVGHLLDTNPSLIRTHDLNRDYGDWLHGGEPTPRHLLATAYLAYSLEVAHHAAAALERSDDAARYARLWHRARGAFAAEFIDDEGHILGDSQTGYAMALSLDLVPADVRALSARRLAATVNETRHLTTGIHGTRFLAPALCDTGYPSVAYDLLLRTEHPSWLAMVRHGATTIWERWDGWTPEHGFHNPRMNSFNHYALGSVAEWLHRYVAGIHPLRSGPAFRHVLVRPHPDRRLGWAQASRQTAGGRLSVRWRLKMATLEMAVSVPASSRALVDVPCTGSVEVATAGTHGTIRSAEGGPARSWTRFECGSGEYRFTAELTEDWRPVPLRSPDRLTTEPGLV